MSLLLDLGYLLGAILASPWIAYRLVKTGGWRRIPSRFGWGLGASLEGCIWLHGSSAGEVSLLKPLVTLLERDRPGIPLLISTYTSTGHAAASKAYPRHRVVLFPVDLSFVVKRFLRRLDPRLIVIVESEFWPNFLLAARRRHVPVVVLNGKMSDKSYRAYSRLPVIPSALRSLELIAVQSEEHAERLRSLGVAAERIEVTGNMKYDLASSGAGERERRELRGALGYGDVDVVVIGGSLHAGEHEAMLDACAAQPRAVSAVIVPRYPADAPLVAREVEQRGAKAVLKTAVDRGAAAPPASGGVLIVDTVGELGRLYGAADIAFVGGSLFFRGSNKGGHNLMEPAIRGVPVLFGPYNFSFKEMVDDLLRAEAGILVRNADELRTAITTLAADAAERTALGERARTVVLQRRGATNRNYHLLLRVIGGDRERLQVPAFERTMPRASGDLDTR